MIRTQRIGRLKVPRTGSAKQTPALPMGIGQSELVRFSGTVGGSCDCKVDPSRT